MTAGNARGLLFAILGLLALQASSADLKDVSVTYVGDRYHMESVAWFDASHDELYKVLTNYDHFSKFTSAFVETRNLAPDSKGRPRFYTRMEGCVLMFCKSMQRNGYLVLKPPFDIVAVAYPDQSDFRYSRERWHLVPEKGGTRMTYTFEMEPAFWVPPVVGPFMIKRTLREGGI
ncbi:MAG: SRPBCC family protein, partial [Woeseia sp.]